LPKPDHDVVIIAGDICQGLSRGVRWIADQGLNEKPVIYVPGNHEYYGFDFEAERAEGRNESAKHRNIHVLDHDAVTINGVNFLGATLWTDYRLFGEAIADAAMHNAEKAMNDHRVIRYRDRRWRAVDAASEHALSRSWLEEQFDRPGKTFIVVTHTAPSPESIAARYKDDLVTAAFASNLEHLVHRASLWVHGHTHVGSDYALGNCRVVNNPRGYAALGEAATFDPRSPPLTLFSQSLQSCEPPTKQHSTAKSGWSHLYWRQISSAARFILLR
jgi:Icc-related predicted phosphoesterase